jgi:tRNA 2-thiouridine synthesizing protein E
MSSMQVAGRELALGPKGFLASFDAWNHDVAEAMAAEQGLVLTRRHWAVIEFLRDYYSEFGHPPSPRLIIQAVGGQLTVDAPCTRRTLESLFPGGACKQACRIAGLPEYYCHSC